MTPSIKSRHHQPKTIARVRFPSGEVGFEVTRVTGGYRLTWLRSATVFISAGGRRVDLKPHPSARRITLLVLRNIAHAYAQSLRGREALHSTVLTRPTGSLAILAPSGEGKSTLAHYCMRHGWGLVTDDFLYTRQRQGRVWPVPTKAWLKLEPNGRGDPSTNPDFDPNFGKRIIPITPPRTVGPLFAFVRILRRSTGSIDLRRLTPAEAVLHLSSNLYNELLRPPHVRRRQLTLATTLARIVPVWTLRFPSGYRHLHRVSRALEAVLDP